MPRRVADHQVSLGRERDGDRIDGVEEIVRMQHGAVLMHHGGDGG